MAKKKAKPKDDDNADDSPVAVNDAWTGMLVISFLALSIGTGFVAFEYGFRYNWGEEPKAVPKAVGGAPAVKPPPAVEPPVQPPPVDPPVQPPP